MAFNSLTFIEDTILTITYKLCDGHKVNQPFELNITFALTVNYTVINKHNYRRKTA